MPQVLPSRLTTFASAFLLGVIFISRRAIEPQPSNINLAGYRYTFATHGWRPQFPVPFHGKPDATTLLPVCTGKRPDKPPDIVVEEGQSGPQPTCSPAWTAVGS